MEYNRHEEDDKAILDEMYDLIYGKTETSFSQNNDKVKSISFTKQEEGIFNSLCYCLITLDKCARHPLLTKLRGKQKESFNDLLSAICSFLALVVDKVTPYESLYDYFMLLTRSSYDNNSVEPYYDIKKLGKVYSLFDDSDSAFSTQFYYLMMLRCELICLEEDYLRNHRNEDLDAEENNLKLVEYLEDKFYESNKDDFVRLVKSLSFCVAKVIKNLDTQGK